MQLLLDTHVWLWATMEPERLNATARSAIETETALYREAAH
jgi:PIN domain nuclease of toxin-antitoxin system